MKFIGIYWTMFAPMIIKSIAARFGKDLHTVLESIRWRKALGLVFTGLLGI